MDPEEPQRVGEHLDGADPPAVDRLQLRFHGEVLQQKQAIQGVLGGVGGGQRSGVLSYAGAVDLHLELVEVQPVPRLLRVQVVVEVPGRKAETVEAQVRGQQERGGALLIGHAGVAALPAPVSIGRFRQDRE